MARTGPIGVFGATGVLGRQVLARLVDRDVPAEDVRLFASADNEQTELDYGAETLPIDPIDAPALKELSGAVLAVPPGAAADLAARLKLEGTWVVDCSGRARVDTAVPLLAPRVNDGVLDRPFAGRALSVVGAAAQASLLVLEPLRAAFGLVLADVTTLHGAAAMGAPGVDALAAQTASLMNGKEPELAVFPHRLAFNVIPEVGDFDGPLSATERALLVELARVWADAPVAVTATSLLVPAYHGLTVVLSIHLERPADAERVRGALQQAPGVKVVDDVAAHVYPMPMLATDDPSVLVGRLRVRTERVQLVAALDPPTLVAEGAVELILRLRAR